MLDSINKVTLISQANLLLHGVAYFLMGAMGFLNPAAKLAQLGFGVPATALTTFRVIYGGLMIGIAAIFVAATFLKGMQAFGLLALILVMVSLIATRTIGAFIDQSFAPSQLLWSGIEFAVLILSITLYRKIASGT